MTGQSLVGVFASAVAPPLVIAAAGFLLGRWREVDVEALSTVTIYVLMPALVFDSLATTSIDVRTALSLVAAMVAFTAATAAVAAVVVRFVAGESGALLTGATLAAAFPNVGNFGIPVATFAFGEVGRTTAVVFVLVQTVLLYSLGVYALSRFGEAGGRGAAIRRVLTLPITYAGLAAIGAVALDVVPPTHGTAMRTIGMVGDAAIPLFLLILGLQLATMSPGTAARRVFPTVGVKLLVAPALALAIAPVAGIADPDAARAFVLLAAAPAAVTPLVLAVEFTGDAQGLSPPDYVGTVIAITILGSLPIVTGLIYLLQAGVVL